MKFLGIIAAVVLSGATAASAQGPSQLLETKPFVDSWRESREQFRQALAKGRIDDARPHAKRIWVDGLQLLVLAKKDKDREDEQRLLFVCDELITVGVWLADDYEARGELEDAVKTHEGIYYASAQRYGSAHYRAVTAKMNWEHYRKLATLSSKQRVEVRQAAGDLAKWAQWARKGESVRAKELAPQTLAKARNLLGDDALLVIEARRMQGHVHLALGKFDEARKEFELAVASRRRTTGEDHPLYAMALGDLANLEIAVGRYSVAERQCARILEILEATIGVSTVDYGVAAQTFGVVLAYLGRYEAAVSWLTKSDELLTANHGMKSPLAMNSRLKLAECYKEQANYDAAEAALRRTIDEAGDANGLTHLRAIAVGQLANLLRVRGKLTEARRASKEALELLRATVGESHPDYSGVLNYLGMIEMESGNRSAAKEHFEEALARLRKHSADSRLLYATVLLNWGHFLAQEGDYGQAEPAIRKALEHLRGSLRADNPLLSKALNALTLCYLSQGDVTRATESLRESFALCQQLGIDHPDTLTTVINAGAMHLRMGNDDEAVACIQLALEKLETALGREHPEYLRAQSSLADIHFARNETSKAEQIDREVLEARRKVLGQYHPAVASSLSRLAFRLLTAKRTEEAVPLSRQAHEIYEKSRCQNSFEAIFNTCLYAIGLARTGQREEAIELIELAMRRALNQVQLAATAQSERQQLRSIQSNASIFGQFVGLSIELKLPADRIYSQVLSWKGIAWSNQRSLRLQRQQATPEVAAQFAELSDISRELTALYYAAPHESQRDARSKQIHELVDRKDRLEADLSRASPAFAAEQSKRRRGFDEWRSSLPDNVTLVDYVIYEWASTDTPPSPMNRQSRLAAFIVRREGPIEILELGPLEPIEQLVDQWRREIGQRRGDDRGLVRTNVADRSATKAEPPQWQLRRLIWEPLENRMGRSTTVLISPDGALSALPFGALPGKAPEQFLLEEMAFVTVPVPNLIPEILADRDTDSVTHANSMLILGDVDFEGIPTRPTDDQVVPQESSSRSLLRRSGSEGFPPLPGTARELAAVAALFRDEFPSQRLTELRGAAASKPALRTLAPRHQVLHLATHGFFADAKPSSESVRYGHQPTLDQSRQLAFMLNPGLLSGLALAGANRSGDLDADNHSRGDDGILTALEVSELDLSGTNLVVLSACETGLGKRLKGEGVLGLQRAFQVAGAKTVAASLWPVPDEPTQMLMERFYGNLWKKRMSRLEALREAQLWMMKEGRRVDVAPADKAGTTDLPPDNLRAPPLYWSSFVLSGDWR